MGYYKVPDGTVFIDDVDINTMNLNHLRKQISYVQQNNKLFNKSIYENIQYGNTMSKEEIDKICEQLHIKNMFQNIKNGFETMAGIEGNQLSGGQRQIIHILRCIGKKNKIIILDEPTSAIDIENKKYIINAIEELGKNNTILLITHDESMLVCVNRVIQIDSGKIIEDYYKK